MAAPFDLRKEHQLMRRAGLPVEEAVTVVDFLALGESLSGGDAVLKFRIVPDSWPAPRVSLGATWRKSGIVDVAGRGGSDGRPVPTGAAVAVQVESGGNPGRGARGAIAGDTKISREGFFGH